MRFLNFAKMKKTWTWEICFPTVEKIIDQNKTRLRHVTKVVEFYGRHERISEKQDGSLVGGTPGFVVSTVHCLSTIYVLSWLFLSQAIFPFRSFCFQFQLRKILAAPLWNTTHFFTKMVSFYTLLCLGIGRKFSRGQWLKWQLRPSLPVPVFLIKYSVLGRDAEINWTDPGGALVDFSKRFCSRAKSDEIWFLPLEIKKTVFLLKIWNSCPSSDTHMLVCRKRSCHTIKNLGSFKRFNTIPNSEILLNLIRKMKYLTDQLQLCFCIGNAK